MRLNCSSFWCYCSVYGNQQDSYHLYIFCSCLLCEKSAVPNLPTENILETASRLSSKWHGWKWGWGGWLQMKTRFLWLPLILVIFRGVSFYRVAMVTSALTLFHSLPFRSCPNISVFHITQSFTIPISSSPVPSSYCLNVRFVKEMSAGLKWKLELGLLSMLPLAASSRVHKILTVMPSALIMSVCA